MSFQASNLSTFGMTSYLFLCYNSILHSLDETRKYDISSFEINSFTLYVGYIATYLCSKRLSSSVLIDGTPPFLLS